MDVLSIIAAIFLENLIAILGLAAFVFLLREYRRRRQAFLLAFALIFFSVFLTNGLLYLGQVLHVYGQTSAAGILVKSRHFMSIVEAALLFWILIELYAGRYKWFLGVFAAAFPLISVYFLVTEPGYIVEFHGLAYAALDLTHFLGIFAAWTAANVALLFVPRLSRSPSRPQKLLMKAGLCGILFTAAAAAAIGTRIEAFFYATYLFYAAHLALLFFGAASIEHPDPLFRERPTAVLTRSLVMKAAGLSALLFWVLAFALLALTSGYFIESSIDSRKEGLRRDVHFFSRSYAGFGTLFLEETSHLADEPDLAAVVKGESAVLPPEVAAYIQRGGGDRILRVVDADGVIVYSSNSPSEVGTSLASSDVVKKALNGKPVAATERDDAAGYWAVRAAVPLRLADGSTGGVVLGTDVRPVLDFSDYSSVVPVTAAGYGFVAENGQQVFAWGQEVDELRKMAFRKALSSQAISSGETSDGDFFAVARVRATDGTPDGWLYTFMTQRMMQTQILRILTLVTFMLLLALAFMTAILTFGVAVVLRPISDLRAAARRIEEGDHSARVSYDSPDELGELAVAFNQMGETIGERTKRLHAALEEERDFLMHTAMEMRSPLNIFRWTIEMMRFGDTGRLTKEQLELLEQMHQTTQRLISFSQNLLDASLLEQGKISLKKQSVRIEDVIDEVAGEYSIKLREKDINLHWNRPAKPLPAVMGDRDRIKQVLMNVIGNAVKYTKENGHVEVTASESSAAGPGARHGKFVKISVEDNGRGIPKAEQARVFTPFFRGSNVVKDDIQGIGLGMFITKELIELHGGKIWFKSDEETGTTFFFTFPAEKTPRRGANEQAPKNNPSL